MFRKPKLFRDGRPEQTGGAPNLEEVGKTDQERTREVQVEQINQNYQDVFLETALEIAADQPPRFAGLEGASRDTIDDVSAVLRKMRDEHRLEDLAAGLRMADASFVERVLQTTVTEAAAGVEDVNDAMYMYIYRLMHSLPLETYAAMAVAEEPPSGQIAA